MRSKCKQFGKLSKKVFIKMVLPFLNEIDEVIYTLHPDLLVCNSACLNITGRCNSRCITCNYAKVYQNKPELSTSDWKKIIDELDDFGIKNFMIVGGEALVRDDCFEIAEYCKGTRYLTTNGILINKDNAKKIVDIFKLVNISIDGSTPEIYKKTRGVDCFDRVIENFKLLKFTGCTIRIYYTISKYNYTDVLRKAELASELGVELVFSLVVFGDFNNILTNDTSLLNEINFDILQDLVSKVLQYDHIFPSSTLEDRLLGRLPKKCFSTGRSLLIDPTGDILLCCGPLPPVDNILKDNLPDIWEKYKKIRYSLLHMKPLECHNCFAYTGNLEYLQEVARKIIKKPIRKFIKRLAG